MKMKMSFGSVVGYSATAALKTCERKSDVSSGLLRDEKRNLEMDVRTIDESAADQQPTMAILVSSFNLANPCPDVVQLGAGSSSAPGLRYACITGDLR